eukprot:gb/GECH01013580.1/.p1 GENE.gb/GECH01013580.1/~~gb/GECH01013580.1/.p1  ORF type:complete len:774 (+),score=143.17 gb/GECH01013580.1/:1-2322(+)
MVFIWGQTQFMGNIPIPGKMPSIPNNVSDISLSGDSTLLLTNSGDCYVFGRNDSYQLGIGPDPNVQYPPRKVEFEQEKIIRADVSNFHSIFLTDVGRVYTCGKGGFGVPSSDIPIEETGLRSEEIVDVVAGYGCLFAKTYDGKVYSWGNGKSGHNGHQKGSYLNEPMLINSLEHVHTIATSKQSPDTIFVDQNDQIFYCGQNNGSYFSFASNGVSYLSQKTDLEFGGAIDDISINYRHLVILCNNHVYYIGSDCFHSKTPKEIEHLRNLNVKHVQAGNDFGAAVTNDHMVYVWGNESNYKLGTGSSRDTLIPFRLDIHPVNNIVCSDQLSMAWWNPSHGALRNQSEQDNAIFETLIQDDTYCDLTIQTLPSDRNKKYEQIQCHRMIMARYPKIKELIDNSHEIKQLNDNDNENNNIIDHQNKATSHISSTMTKIHLRLPYPVVELAVRFAYGESFEIDSNHIDNLCAALHAAYILEMDDLGRYALYEYSILPPEEQVDTLIISDRMGDEIRNNHYSRKIFTKDFGLYSQYHSSVDPYSLLKEHLSQLYPYCKVSSSSSSNHFSAKLYPDITLKSNDQKCFTVHRAILALNTRFAAKLRGGQRLSDADSVDHRSDVLQHIIRYLYSGEEEFSSVKVMDLGYFIEEFRICSLPVLADACKRKLREMAVHDEYAFQVIEVCTYYRKMDPKLDLISELAQSHLANKHGSDLVKLIPQYFMQKEGDSHAVDDENEALIIKEFSQMERNHEELQKNYEALKKSHSDLHYKVDQILKKMN